MSPRLPRGSLSRHVVLDAAAALLAEGGVEAVGMRRVAASLGADPAALYRYVRGRDDLLAGLVDRLLDDVALPDPGIGWRAAVVELGVRLHDTLVAGGGAVELVLLGPHTGRSAALVEASLDVLVRAGLPPTRAARAVQAVVALVVGAAAQQHEQDGGGFWTDVLDAAQPVGDHSRLHTTTEVWHRPHRRQLLDALALLVAGLDGDEAPDGEG